MAGEDDAANDAADTDDDDSDALAKLTEASDQILDHWEQSQTEEVRTATVKQFIDDDTLVDLEAAGLNAEQAQSIISAYSMHVEHSILKPAGLSLDVWDSYISDDDRPAFRRACVNGEWGVLRATPGGSLTTSPRTAT